MRLIDADALPRMTQIYEFNGKRMEKEIVSARFIDNAPTIDAVPVVRCKDCKYWDEHSQYGYDSENDVYGNYCMIWTPDDDFYAVETPEDGFCYNGERKSDE